MKKILIGLFSFLMMTQTTIAQSSVDARCHTPERGGCPFKIGDLYVLDRCTGSNPLDPQRTTIGNTLCDVFNNIDVIMDNLNKGVNKYKADAEKEFKQHLTPIFKDAIDPQALADFNQATKFYMEIYNEIKKLAADPQCGVNQMKNIQKFFNDQMANLNSVKDIMSTSLAIISKEIPPAIQNLNDFTTELGKALTIAAGQGQKGQEDLKKIQEALNTLKQQLNAINAFDVAGVVKSTTDIVVQVGGLYAKCVSCATAATTTIVEIQKATAETGTAFATPETWELAGGTAWLIPVAGLDAAVAATATMVTPAACGPMFEAIENIGNDIEALKNYYKKVSQMAGTVKQSIVIIEAAGENLAKLVSAASNELKPSLQKMAQSLSALDKRVDAVFNGINKKVLPKVEAVTITITTQLANNAEHLYNCSQEYVQFAERVTTETVQGIRDMFAAATQILDAGKVMDNLGQGFNTALNSAKDKAQQEFNNVKQAYAALEASVCVKRKSNGEIDGPATADCIKNKLFKNGPEAYLQDAQKILDNARKLSAAITELAVKAADAAKDAYANKPEAKDKAIALAKSRNAREEANSAMVKIKKATKREFALNAAKEAAKQKAKQKLAEAKNAKPEVVDPKLTQRSVLAPTVVSFSTSKN